MSGAMRTGLLAARGLRRGALLLAACSSAVLAAQDSSDLEPPSSVSRPVVQPIGNTASARLNQALLRLADNPQDLDSLIVASDAALELGDVEAAVGFLTRADAVSPGNARVKAAIGAALVQNENPYDAIPYFDQAEAAGADLVSIAADRALAFDMVGDQTSAQVYYKLAMDKAPSDEIRRRYAVSLAVSGDRRLAEAVLSPLIQRQDPAAWRARTFVLAITGADDEASAIAYQMMPKDLADGITPYLRYMPRLTAAQQVAAANFGKFPRAADIGRDDPRAAQFAAAPPRHLPMADAGLVPKGEPLGPKDTGKKGKKGKEKVRVATAPASIPTPGPSGFVRRRPGSVDEPPVQVAAAPPPPTLRPAPAPAPKPAPTPVAAPRSTPAPAAAPLPSPVPASIAPPPAAPKPAPAPAPGPGFSSVAVATPTPGPAPIAAGPSFDLAQVGKPAATPAPAPKPAVVLPPPTPVPAPVPAPAPVAAPNPAPAAPAGFGAVFGDFRPPAEEQSSAVAAVDITRITPAKPKPAPAPAPVVTRGSDARGERPDAPTAVSRGSDKATAAKGKAKTPPPPSHPSRIWVQVLTGGNRDLLPAEWRKLAKEAPEAFRGKKAYVTPWRSNFRLLTGPFESEAAAQAFLNQIRRGGVEGFLWTSAAGQPVDVLANGK
jgi:Flp pilus assembly protein TadD